MGFVLNIPDTIKYNRKNICKRFNRLCAAVHNGAAYDRERQR